MGSISNRLRGRRAIRAAIAVSAACLAAAAGAVPAANAGTLYLSTSVGPGAPVISGPMVSDPCGPLGYPNLTVLGSVVVCAKYDMTYVVYTGGGGVTGGVTGDSGVTYEP